MSSGSADQPQDQFGQGPFSQGQPTPGQVGPGEFGQPRPGQFSQPGPGQFSQPGPGQFSQPGPGQFSQPGQGEFGQPGQGEFGQPGPGQFSPGQSGPPPGWSPPPYTQGGPYVHVGAGWPQMAGRRTNPLAIAALCCAVGQLIAGPFAGIAAIVLGAMSLKQIRMSGEDGRGLAITGLILGIVGTILALLLILLFVAIFHGVATNVNNLNDIQSHLNNQLGQLNN
jgi:hypothetical protein